MSSSNGIDEENTSTMEPAAVKTTLDASSSAVPLIRTLHLFSLSFFICFVVFFFTRDISTGLIRLQDVLTMLNPLILVPLFYLVHLVDAKNQVPNAICHIVFLLLAIVYVHGDGFHLAANAIHRYPDDLNSETVRDIVYLYDEQLGHYYPYAGLMGLHLLWLYRQEKLPFTTAMSIGGMVGLVGSGMLHGLSLFIAFIEGKFGIPAIVFFCVVGGYSLYQRQRLGMDPIFLFSLAYAVTGLILMIVWASWQGGLPELTEAGLV